jgi:hypothetical protein
MGYCEKPRKMPAGIAGVSAGIRTGHLQTNPEALLLGGRGDSPNRPVFLQVWGLLKSCSVTFTLHYVRCPTTILSDLAWPCTVSLSAYFANLACRYFSVLLPASPHSRKCCLGRWQEWVVG